MLEALNKLGKLNLKRRDSGTMASNQDRPIKGDVAKASKLRQQAAEAEFSTKRHKGKSWEAVRSARKSFFNKISNSAGK